MQVELDVINEQKNAQVAEKPETNPLDKLRNCDTTKRIMMLIEDHQKATGYVDTRAIAENLRFNVNTIRFPNSTDIAVMYRDDDGQRVIDVASMITVQEQNSVIAWLLAEYLLNDRRLSQSKPIQCSIFILREFRKNRYSRTMLLATRLTMTEETIEKMTDLDNRLTQRVVCEQITPEFANSAVKGHSVSFLIGNDYI